MIANNIKAYPLSNLDIVLMTKQVRHFLKLGELTRIDIIKVLEFALPLVVPNFSYVIRAIEDMDYPDKHAYCIPDKNIIVIREDIYERAVKGEGRDRFTIAHEIAHLLLHKNEAMILTRVYNNETIKTFENPEWQADAFAGELLCPARATRTMTVQAAADFYGVSLDAARNQKKKGGK